MAPATRLVAQTTRFVVPGSGDLLTGAVCHGGRWAWRAHESQMHCVNVRSGATVCAYAVDTADTYITAVEEAVVYGVPMLAIGLVEGRGGRVVLFDISSSRVVLSCSLPYRVSAVIPVPCDHQYHRDAALRRSLGVADGNDDTVFAVAGENGRLLLVDLAYDSSRADFVRATGVPAPRVAAETADATEFDADGVPTSPRRRGRHLRKRDQRLYFELNDACFSSPSSSTYRHPMADGSPEPLCVARGADACVTSIVHVPEVALLCVGFRFGGFLAYSMRTGLLALSTMGNVPDSPITSFVFVMPQDDVPFGHLWVCQGCESLPDDAASVRHDDSSASSSSFARLSLYQIEFEAEPVVASLDAMDTSTTADGPSSLSRIVYLDVKNVFDKMSHPLISGRDAVASRVISARALADARSGEPNRCYFVWESLQRNNTLATSIAIFDTGRWYSARQHPIDRGCGFFAEHSLTELDPQGGPVLDVWVDTSTVHDFSSDFVGGCAHIDSPAVDNPNYWTDSFTYEVRFLLSEAAGSAVLYGQQEQQLHDLVAQGPAAMIDPYAAYVAARRTGLILATADLPADDLAAHRARLFDVCFEHNLVALICKYITLTVVSDGVVGAATTPATALTSSGVNVDAPVYATDARPVLDWAWDVYGNVRERIESALTLLRSGSHASPFDAYLRRRTLALLDAAFTRLGYLYTIFQAFLSRDSTEEGSRELERRLDDLLRVSQYVEMLTWLVHHEFLPEQLSVALALPNQFKFPAPSLALKVQTRREARARAYQHGNHDDDDDDDDKDKQCSGVPKPQRLLVDRLAPGSNIQYPPESITEMLEIFAIGAPGKVAGKRQLVYYLLLDLDASPNMLRSFARAFAISPGLARTLRGFWLLDCHDPRATLDLCHPSAQSRDHSETVLRALVDLDDDLKTLASGASAAPPAPCALAYFRAARSSLTTAAGGVSAMRALMACGLVSEAFEFQRHHARTLASIGTHDAAGELLLFHLFRGCQRHGRMADILQMPLDATEEAAFVRFFKQQGSPAAREHLLMFYVQRRRCVEASRLNDALRTENVAATPHSTAARNAIATACRSMLPAVQRELTAASFALPAAAPSSSASQSFVDRVQAASSSSSHAGVHRRPQPLSVTLLHDKRTAVPRGDARTALIRAVMSQVVDTRQDLEVASSTAKTLTTTPAKARSDRVLTAFGRSAMDTTGDATSTATTTTTPPEPFCGPPMTPSRTPQRSARKTTLLFPTPKRQALVATVATANSTSPIPLGTTTTTTTPHQRPKTPSRPNTAAAASPLLRSGAVAYAHSPPMPALSLLSSFDVSELPQTPVRTATASSTTTLRTPQSILKKAVSTVPNATTNPVQTGVEDAMQRQRLKTPPRRTRLRGRHATTVHETADAPKRVQFTGEAPPVNATRPDEQLIVADAGAGSITSTMEQLMAARHQQQEAKQREDDERARRLAHEQEGQRAEQAERAAADAQALAAATEATTPNVAVKEPSSSTDEGLADETTMLDEAPVPTRLTFTPKRKTEKRAVSPPSRPVTRLATGTPIRPVVLDIGASTTPSTRASTRAATKSTPAAAEATPLSVKLRPRRSTRSAKDEVETRALQSDSPLSFASPPRSATATATPSGLSTSARKRHTMSLRNKGR